MLLDDKIAVVIEAIFFDQDNTIVNTKAVAPRAYRQAIEFLAQKMEVKSDRLWRKWRRVVRENRKSLDPKVRSLNYSFSVVCDNKKWIKEAILGIEKMLRSELELNPGAKEFFDIPRGKIKYILTTEDFPHFMKVKINKFKLKRKFDLIIGNREAGSMKPSLKYYQLAWEKFELNPAKCIYIGDKYEKDCEIGAEKGGTTVLFGNKDKRANYQIRNFLVLSQIIKKIDVQV